MNLAMNPYQMYLDVDGELYRINDFDMTCRQDPEHPDFPNAPFNYEIEISIFASKKLHLINAWLAEGKERKDVKTHYYHEEEELMCHTFYNTYCSDYSEYYNAIAEEVVCKVALQPTRIHHNNLHYPGLSALINRQANKG